METFGYSAYATDWVPSSGHVLAVHLVTWLLRTTPGSTSSFGLTFLSLDTITVIPGQSFRSRSLSRDAAARLLYWKTGCAESRLLGRLAVYIQTSYWPLSGKASGTYFEARPRGWLRLWRLPCMYPYTFTPQT